MTKSCDATPTVPSYSRRGKPHHGSLPFGPSPIATLPGHSHRTSPHAKHTLDDRDARKRHDRKGSIRQVTLRLPLQSHRAWPLR